MKRLLLNLLTALSLLLFVAAAVLWVRSHLGVDVVQVTAGRHRWHVATAGGRFALLAQTNDLFLLVPKGWRGARRPGRGETAGQLLWMDSVSSPAHPYTGGGRRLLGFWWGTLRSGNPPTATFVVIGPLWPLALPPAVPPALLVVRRLRRPLRRARQTASLCPSCGYDLRATPGRCPECGRIAPSPPAP